MKKRAKDKQLVEISYKIKQGKKTVSTHDRIKRRGPPILAWIWVDLTDSESFLLLPQETSQS